MTDVVIVGLRKKAIVAPRSALGMLWLQMHFADDEWEVLSQGSFVLSRACATEMIIDAQDAQLDITFE